MGSVTSPDIDHLQALARLVRYHCLKLAGTEPSAHLIPALASADLMTGLLFGGSFHFDVAYPEHPDNDRLLVPADAAFPLFHALWAATGAIDEDALESPHATGSWLDKFPPPTTPTAPMPVATSWGGHGSIVGFGLGLLAATQFDDLEGRSHRTHILLNGAASAENTRWGLMHQAARCCGPNLVGITNISRVSHRRQKRPIGRDVEAYARRIAGCGWQTLLIDGHDFSQILAALREATASTGRPVMIIARTRKNDGLSYLGGQGEIRGLDAEGWKLALAAIANVDRKVRGRIPPPRAHPPLALRGAALTRLAT